MSSNLRSKPIEGHVTDSAGNVLRNAEITIKVATPSGSFPIDTIRADDDGYFRSSPIPSGQYDIYESGIRVAKTIHVANQNPIQCFRPHVDNYDQSKIGNFFDLAEANELQVGGIASTPFHWFVQIEPDIIDVPVYGSTFPLYDMNISTDPAGSVDNTLYNLSAYFGLSSDSRITTTRFDVEYYAPITALSSQYKRVRWAGVPAIRFFPDSKLVIPLDFFSIVPSLHKQIAPSTSDFVSGDNIRYTEASGIVASITGPETNDDFDEFLSLISKGDVVKIILQEIGEGEDTQIVRYGIVDDADTSLIIEKWLSSRFNSDDLAAPDSDYFVVRMMAYDGLFPGIVNIDEEVNERFTVIENVSVQNNDSELYTYNNS